MIAKIEKHSLEALPALGSEKYDGWCLRFADGHTRRANSVNILEPGELPLDQKVAHCENAYKKAGQPCHFRLTPLADPALERLLEKRRYGLFDPTEVRVMASLQTRTFSPADRVSINQKPTETWLEALARLVGQSPEKQATFLKMIERTEQKTQFASIASNGRIVSCGLGIGSNDFIGLFEFATDPEFQRHGMARDIVHALLADAQNRGTETAYLQVVTSNSGGTNFWSKMGFHQCLYRYHYRSNLGT